MNRSRVTTIAAFAFTLLVGQITDRTTGQPLRGVHVEVVQGRTTLRSTSDADGRFRIAHVAPGKHVLHYASRDVPPKTIAITVRGAKQHIEIDACSTTLDYSCALGGGS